MGEKVTISYRGAGYELGRGKRSYGIWAAVTPRSEPVARFPETPEGWVAAWTRFTALEAPGAIAPVGKVTGSPAGADVIDTGGTDSAGAVGVKSAPVAAGLLAFGVLLGVIGLFPGYVSSTSLASQPVNLVPHVCYFVAWAIAAALIVSGGVRRQAGALLALGTSVITFGLFCVDMATVAAEHPHDMGPGLILSLIGWLACAAGAEVAFRLRPSGSIGLPRGLDLARVGLLVVAAIGAVIAFAPSWDSYLLRFSTTSQMLGAGNAFSLGAWLTSANIIVMIVFLAVVVVAALWRPLQLGGMLLAGAVIPMAAQAVSAIVQAVEPTTPAQLGISSAQATQLGLSSITNGLTPAFWIYCLFVVVLAVSCIWMLITPSQAVPAAVESSPDGPSWPAAVTAPSAVESSAPAEVPAQTQIETQTLPVAAPSDSDGFWDTAELTRSEASAQDD
jgi:hypothetical protein